MPVAGAVQVTWVGVSCLQAEAGSRPVASLLLFARRSAFISALGTGSCDVVPGAPACAPEPLLRPIQVPRPATTRTAAASTAIQRGCRYQRGPRGPRGDGGAPAARSGSAGPAAPCSRRWEATVPPEWPAPARPAAGWPYPA